MKVNESEMNCYAKRIRVLFCLHEKFLYDVYSYVNYFQSINTDLYFFKSIVDISLVTYLQVGKFPDDKISRK